VPSEDGRLTPETCKGSRHNKVIVKVNVYQVGYVIVKKKIVCCTNSSENVTTEILVLYLTVKPLKMAQLYFYSVALQPMWA
jgi:hypothetical protein